MNFELKGVVVEVSDIRKFTDTFSKRELVIKTMDRWPSEFPIEFVNDEMNVVSNLKPGTEVTVHGYMRATKTKDGTRRFVNLRGVDVHYGKVQQPLMEQQFNEAQDLAKLDISMDNPDDGLPF